MKDIEQRIIDFIQDLKINNKDMDEIFFNDDVQDYFAMTKIGHMSADFVSHPALDAIIASPFELFKLLGLRIVIEDFLHNADNEDTNRFKLERVRQVLLKFLENAKAEDKLRGTAVIPDVIANDEFIKGIYFIKNEALINLIHEYLPRPQAFVFNDMPVPESIRQKEKQATEYLQSYDPKNLPALEKATVQMQRNFRAHKREKETLARVTHLYNKQSANESQAIIDDANTPYRPKTNAALADRLVNTAQKIILFTEVKHNTSPKALESIMNHGILGRQTLRNFYMPFKPASLSAFDIKQGDLNVVCMGAFGVDPKARHGIILTFDYSKMLDNNACIFFKQKDLGYVKRDAHRSLYIGNTHVVFSHTESDKLSDYNHDQYHLFQLHHIDGASNNKQPVSSSLVLNQSVISSNMICMHQILVLNFFRYVDGLDDKHAIATIYDSLNSLSNEDLQLTLEEIGRNISDTMEFNIYGSYQIDFNALTDITNEKQGYYDGEKYTLNMLSFIADLNSGKQESLDEAKYYLPGIFKSYRFVDYLLTRVTEPSMVGQLNTMRAQCTTPHYMKPH